MRPFFQEFSYVELRIELSINMLRMATRLVDKDMQADGLTNPWKWYIVHGSQQNFVFFAGVTDLIIPRSGYTQFFDEV